MVVEQPVNGKIPPEPREVGGELLDILSRGLYTDAKDALREYVQNSVDARASTVHVSIDGPVATVRDDGEGVDFPTLRRARATSQPGPRSRRRRPAQRRWRTRTPRPPQTHAETTRSLEGGAAGQGPRLLPARDRTPTGNLA